VNVAEWVPRHFAEPGGFDRGLGAPASAPSTLGTVVLGKNVRGDWSQHVVMMQAAETGMGHDAMSGW
jgi:hypothetical protein